MYIVFNGYKYNVARVEIDSDFKLPLLVTEGASTDLLVAKDEAAVRRAVDEYWTGLLLSGPEFIDKIGGWGVIVAWVNHQVYAPCPDYGNSFVTFIDWAIEHPEEFLDMDGLQGYTVQDVSEDLVEELGFISGVVYNYKYKEK